MAVRYNTAMNQTKYTIYWTLEGCPGREVTFDLKLALDIMNNYRKCPGYSAIVMASENVDQIGQMGVDAVKDGVLPDGQEYVYKTGRDRGRESR
jgi:hypothetical protein